jgi:quinol monooxygenase YgiN
MLHRRETTKGEDGNGAARPRPLAKQLFANVRSGEPGCCLYALHKADAPLIYVLMERYADQAAVEAHRGTDYFKALGRKMGEFMDGRPEVLRLTEI